MKKLFIAVFFLMLISNKTNAQKLVTEGILNSISSHSVEGCDNYIWFKDSVAITVMLLHYGMDSAGISIKGIRPYMYTITDLRTLRTQSYTNFSDTALPITNYKYSDTDNVVFNYTNRPHPYDVFIDSLKNYPDTIINKVNFKRRYFDITYLGFCQRTIYYFEKPTVFGIFNAKSKLDKLIPDYKYSRTQYIHNLKYSEFSYNDLISTKLSDEVNKIFRSWETNLYQSKLPITNQQKAMQNFSEFTASLEYEAYKRSNNID